MVGAIEMTERNGTFVLGLGAKKQDLPGFTPNSTVVGMRNLVS
jgi:hypothetical protein